MIVWMIVFVVCLYTAAKVVLLLEDRLKAFLINRNKGEFGAREMKALDRIVVPMSFTLVCVLGFGIPIASTFFVEYPSLIERPSIATFDNSGRPVYHKWGLVTLPWDDKLEAANVPYPDECRSVGNLLAYNDLTPFLVEKDGSLYRVSFEVSICLEAPERYYAKKERRRIGLVYKDDIFETVRDQTAKELLFYQEEHLEQLKVATRECNLKQFKPYEEERCEAVENELLLGVPARDSFFSEGLSLKIKSQINKVQLD